MAEISGNSLPQDAAVSERWDCAGDIEIVNANIKAVPMDGAVDKLILSADSASKFLKALGHDGRLTILCHLLGGPKSVTELENLLSARQAVVSQQLARLRLERLVAARRDGNAIFYSIEDDKVRQTVVFLANLFEDGAYM